MTDSIGFKRCKECLHKHVCFSARDKFRLSKIKEFGFYTKRYNIMCDFTKCTHFKSVWIK